MGTFYSVRGKLVGKAEPCAGVKASTTVLNDSFPPNTGWLYIFFTSAIAKPS